MNAATVSDRTLFVFFCRLWIIHISHGSSFRSYIIGSSSFLSTLLHFHFILRSIIPLIPRLYFSYRSHNLSSVSISLCIYEDILEVSHYFDHDILILIHKTTPLETV